MIVHTSYTHASTPDVITLDGHWRLTQADRHVDIDALVPGVVQSDLLATGKIPDPFYRDNENAVHWVGEVPWKYARTFTVSASMLGHRHIVLRCEGLDTLAHVEVNGIKVADTDNMFRTWEFDVRPLLHTGANTIAVSFDPVEPYLRARDHQAAFPDKPMSGWGYIRKAPFQQGWDFAPKIITCGIWRDIELVGWDDARLTDVGVNQRHSNGAVDLEVDVEARVDGRATADVRVSFHGRTVTKSTGPIGTSTLHIAHPRLWWPNGMGPQNLYDVDIELHNAKGVIVDRGHRTIGLRTVAWLPKTDKHPLTLTVNGRPFYAKGSNWVPCDSIISRASAARERALVDQAVDAHMNLMRLWGGGYYEEDALFDECDRKGLMLWSEFQYADAAYPIFDPKWLDNVKAETEDNVRRLRNHPCIAIWSGNNECIGFVADKTGIDHMSRSDYDLLYHQVLPGIVHKLSPSAMYTPGSPEAGDDHDWSVWHGGASFESYRDVHGFMSEFGYQSFPQPKTVDAYTNHADRASVLTPVMRYHQRNWGSGNAMIVANFKRYYQQPKDFNTTLWLSQIQEADGVLTGVEHWRRDWPHSSGSLVWQFDDCWPTASWAMMDYYGRPKALYYRLKRAYEPLMLSGEVDGKTKTASLWAVNDKPVPVKARLSWRLEKTDGTVVDKGTTAMSIPAGESSTRVLSIPCKAAVDKVGAGNVLLFATLRSAAPNPNNGGPELSNTVLGFTKPKNIALQDPGLAVSVLERGGRAESGLIALGARPYNGVRSFAVTVTAKQPALSVWVDMPNVDAHYSDNFIDLPAGGSAMITIRPAKRMSMAQVAAAVRVRSLFDTYLPGQVTSTAVKAGVDGSIYATADEADIEGTQAFVEAPVAGTPPGTPGNIANWQNMGDYLVWTVNGAKPGSYTAVANVACPPGEEGSTFTVDVDGSKVSGTMPSTRSWWDYVDITLGTVTISKAGTISMVLTPTSKPAQHVGNLRYLKLTPSP